MATSLCEHGLRIGELEPAFEATVREGRVAHALPHDAVLELLDGHRRLGVR